MAKISKEKYCVLRIPITTREAICKIAIKQNFKPRWTDVANEMLLWEIKKYNNNIK